MSIRALWIVALLIASPALAFTHGAGVYVPPSSVVVSGVSPGTPTSSGTTISWTSTPPANARVCYGLTTSYATCLIRHGVAGADTETLSGLTSNTAYFFRIDATLSGYTTGIATGTFTTAAVTASCPFGTGGADGCGSTNANGLYYVPWTNPADPRIPVAQPTWAQFSSYARQSGQTWTTTHTPGGGAPNINFNLAGIDYGVGPSQLVSSMADIAGWAQGTNNCFYLSAADGYDATHNNAVSFTGTGNNGAATLTGVTFTSGTPVAGMELVPSTPTGSSFPAGVSNGVFIVSVTGVSGSATVNLSGVVGNHGLLTYYGSNTYFGNNSATFTWNNGYPAFVCGGATSGPFTISGQNFAETAYQTSPVGTHGCVNVITQPTNSGTYAPAITFSNNAIIDGATCDPILSGGGFYGLMTAVSTQSKVLWNVHNNFVWGRNADPCCLNSPTHFGIFLQTANSWGGIDAQYNFFYQIGNLIESGGWVTGNEQTYPCSNGTAWSWPGYSNVFSHNMIDNFGSVYGGGHFEITNIGTGSNSPGICQDIKDYNVVNVPGTMSNSTLGPFFGFGASSPSGVLEYGEVKNNLLTGNRVGGKLITDPLVEHYNWQTDGGSPVNHIVVTGNGASCGVCPGPTRGQGISGGTGNTFNSQVGLQNLTSGSAIGGPWNAGCNQQDNAGSGICRIAGNSAQLTAGVTYPSSGSILDSAFNNNIESVSVLNYGHGSSTLGSWQANGATSGATQTTIPITAGSTCPVNGVAGSNVAGNNANNALVYDTDQSNAFVGVIQSCASGVSIILYGLQAVTVGSADHLAIKSFAYGTLVFANNYVDASGTATGAYFVVQPALLNGTGFQQFVGGSGGCGVPVSLSGNVDLTGGAGNPNVLSGTAGGC